LFYIDVFNAMINEKGIPIKDYFTADGLHMNEKGYAVWRNIIIRYLSWKN
jgi:lysophospholipase L1-like esterase